jgi:hypothetical protein
LSQVLEHQGSFFDDTRARETGVICGHLQQYEIRLAGDCLKLLVPLQ